jgi:uncharacterized membrane protein YeiB
MTATLIPTETPTTTLITTTTTTSPRAGGSTKAVGRAGALSGLVAAVATTAVAVGAELIDIPMKAAPRTEEVGRAIPLSGYAMGTLLCTAIGTVLAVGLYRWAKRPDRTFVVLTVVLTMVSFAGPITAGHATTATRLVLALTHVVAAVIVIPAVARRLAPRPARP